MVDMMARVGLQPEAEQEKRMIQNCVDPSRLVKQNISQMEGEGFLEEEEREEEGNCDG